MLERIIVGVILSFVGGYTLTTTVKMFPANSFPLDTFQGIACSIFFYAVPGAILALGVIAITDALYVRGQNQSRGGY